jgi:hypothetical protein
LYYDKYRKERKMSAAGERKDIVDSLRFIANSSKASEASQISIISTILEMVAATIEEGAEEPLLFRLIAFANKEGVGDYTVAPPAKDIQ